MFYYADSVEIPAPVCFGRLEVPVAPAAPVSPELAETPGLAPPLRAVFERRSLFPIRSQY